MRTLVLASAFALFFRRRFWPKMTRLWRIASNMRKPTARMKLQQGTQRQNSAMRSMKLTLKSQLVKKRQSIECGPSRIRLLKNTIRVSRRHPENTTWPSKACYRAQKSHRKTQTCGTGPFRKERNNKRNFRAMRDKLRAERDAVLASLQKNGTIYIMIKGIRSKPWRHDGKIQSRAMADAQ